MNRLARLGHWLLNKFGDPCALGSDTDLFDVDQIRDAQWHQGSVLPPDAVKWLQLHRLIPGIDADGIWCVITQDCDLVHHDLRNEPTVEVVYGQRVDKPDNGYSWSKNARTLHVRDDGFEQAFAFHSRDRHAIPRSVLCRFKPLSNRLSDDTVRLLVRWVSRKYFRAAFPDNFNRRIDRKTEGKIKKFLSKSAGQLKEIHINVSSEELREDEVYKIAVLCVGDPEHANETDSHQATLRIGDDLEKLLSHCDGIEVTTCDVRFPNEITLEDVDPPVKRWDFDSITIRQSDSIDDAPVDR